MSYVCVRPINLSGNYYYPGQPIKDEHIVPGRIRTLKAHGLIAEAEDFEKEATGITAGTLIKVPVVSAGGEQIELKVEGEDVAEVFRIMQMNAEGAVEAIKDIKKEEVLILIHSTDSRQSVKKAAKAQAEKL